MLKEFKVSDVSMKKRHSNSRCALWMMYVNHGNKLRWYHNVSVSRWCLETREILMIFIRYNVFYEINRTNYQVWHFTLVSPKISSWVSADKTTIQSINEVYTLVHKPNILPLCEQINFWDRFPHISIRMVKHQQISIHMSCIFPSSNKCIASKIKSIQNCTNLLHQHKTHTIRYSLYTHIACHFQINLLCWLSLLPIFFVGCDHLAQSNKTTSFTTYSSTLITF